MKTLLWIIGGIALLGSGLFLTGKWLIQRSEAAARQPLQVRAEPVARGNLIETISAPGEVEPKKKVSISARVAARIEKLPFKEGDKVTAGNPAATPPIPPSVLVKLDATELEAALKSVEARKNAQGAQLTVSKKLIEASRSRIVALNVTLADAQRDLRRQKQLFESNDVAQSVVDTAQSKVDELKASLIAAERSLSADEAGLDVMKHNLEAADAEIARARDNLNYTTITSPIDGVVTRLNAEVGELVVTGTMNNAGTIVMEVADLSQMLMKARVDETSIADVQVGQKAKIHLEAYREKLFEGTVVAVALANFDPNQSRGGGALFSRGSNSDGSKFFKVEILLDTGEKRVFSGLSGDVDIETRRFDNVLKVPSQAVVGRPADSLPQSVRESPDIDRARAVIPVVYRCIDGKAVVTPVTIGASDLTHTVIKSGIAEGDQIITGPYKVLESIQHDQAIKPEMPATMPSTQPSTLPTTRPAN